MTRVQFASMSKESGLAMNGGSVTQPRKDSEATAPEEPSKPDSSNPVTAPTPMGHYSSEPSEAWAEAIAEGARAARIALESKRSKPK